MSDLRKGTLKAAGTVSWFQTPDMKFARRGHTATLLQNGTVLVIGGFQTDSSEIAEAEVYFSPVE